MSSVHTPSRGKRNVGLVRVLAFGTLLFLSACAHLSPTPTFDAPRTEAIDRAILDLIGRKQTPGATYYLQSGSRVYTRAYGSQTYGVGANLIDVQSIYDAASLTKVVATTPAVMQLVDAGKLALDEPFTTYLPDCASNGKALITLRHLLTHSSGLAAGLSRATPWLGKAEAIRRACDQSPTNPPGSMFRYSDINFILLGAIVEQVSGQPLDVYVQSNILAPLKMSQSGYLPLARFSLDRIVPTQRETESGVDTLLQGAVHDPTARVMGGVAGHAGLFTTVGDLARYARMLLNGGELDGVRVLSRQSVRLMTTPQSPQGIKETRAIGFDINSPYARPRGAKFSMESVGHTGFTGCILWIDPTSNSFFAFLSNRVHPDAKASIVPFYSVIGTLSAEAALAEGSALPR